MSVCFYCVRIVHSVLIFLFLFLQFFRPLKPVNIEILYERGRPSGEANVEFASYEEANRAMMKVESSSLTLNNTYIIWLKIKFVNNEIFCAEWKGVGEGFFMESKAGLVSGMNVFHEQNTDMYTYICGNQDWYKYSRFQAPQGAVNVCYEKVLCSNSYFSPEKATKKENQKTHEKKIPVYLSSLRTNLPDASQFAWKRE